ncbi:hypothetical protein [Paraburkholderia sp. BCC1885]|uniref:hypothetical protein n=1 Tax=Paraburkholderia sp. BCC1885 TaxID=2562669 RepID=UPI0011823C8E|nr:hypothetical protein [Paraburkholderia sp. BCC1885]
MANEIVLSAATEYVATADIPELIAQALHPDTAGQQLTVSYFIKFAGPGSTGETARWNGWPIDDDDRKVLDRIWADMPRLPDHPTSDEVQPYLEMANNAELDWILDVCWNNPELTSTILRFDAEREHRKAIVSAVRNGALKVVAPHTRLPTDEYQPNSQVSVEELTRYVAQFTIAVRTTSNRDMASAAPQLARRQQTEQESPFVFPPKLLKLSLWDLACLHTGQNATDDRPTNETRHKLAELVQSVYGRRLWVEWPPGTDFDFVSGFVPTAANARVDTDWRELDRITVRREDWERYEDEMQRELAQRSELIQEQVTLWERRQPANLFAGDGFSEELLQLTTLSKYLEFETWTPETAALLVSGIQAHIPCDEIPSKGAMGLDNCFIIGTQDPFHQARWVLELWRSRENPPIRVRPMDFIAWCKTKNIDTSWLRAVEENVRNVKANVAYGTPTTNAFSADDRRRFLDAQYWNEQELLALCLGVPKYADVDDIAPEAEREDTRTRISAAIQSGQLPAERNPSAGYGEAVYGGIWRIEPARAVRWALGNFDRLPDWLTDSQLQQIFAMQEAEKQAAGRYTLREAAKAIAGTGERFEALEAKLCGAAERRELPVHGPGERARYEYTNGRCARPFYEEAHWDDLNTWLEKNEPRIMFRFPSPAARKATPTAASIQETPEQYRQRAIAVLDKHNGNKTKAGEELGISRQRVGQLVKEKSQAGRAATNPNDPFNRTTLPRKKRT